MAAITSAEVKPIEAPSGPATSIEPLSLFKGPSSLSVASNPHSSLDAISQVPLGSISGALVTPYAFPCTHTSLTIACSVKRSPSLTTRLATLPCSIVPCVFSSPSQAAGVVVSAAKASADERPRATAILKFGMKSLIDESPSEVNANLTPTLANSLGLVGARYQ